MELYTSVGSIVYFSLSLTYILCVYLLDKHIRNKVTKGWSSVKSMYADLKGISN